jgi:hypothetical protein
VWRDGVLVPGDAWRSAKMKELLLHLLTCPEGRTREQIGLVFWPDASAAQVKNTSTSPCTTCARRSVARSGSCSRTTGTG